MSCAICVHVFRDPYVYVFQSIIASAVSQPLTCGRLRCGHTFCQVCLEGYFDTKLQTHIQINPDYAEYIHNMPRYRLVLQQHDMDAEVRQHILGEIAAINATAPRPELNCPTCRLLVLSRPSWEISPE